MTLKAQKKLAISLLQWHGGQACPLYALGSCMLSDSEKGRVYDPANHYGHGETVTETPEYSHWTAGALTKAIYALREIPPHGLSLKCVREITRLASQLEKFQP